MQALPFKEIWLLDFEFSAPDGERPAVRCMVAIEYYSKRKITIWFDGNPVPPPFDLGNDVPFVAFFSSAEWNCFLVLGWSLPRHVLDLYVETKWLICGRDGEPGTPSLICALDRLGLQSLNIEEKEGMRQLAMSDDPFSDVERKALLEYCEADVNALIRLLSALLPKIH